MVWFKQQYLWIIICAAAVCVSCQELTSTLRNGNRACQGEEVIFNCTIRGTNLILAWSSTEYIGQGNPLRFTTQDTPGRSRTSEMNGNVTATLISNTNIDGVPTLVSELRIVADQASTVTCTSETTSSPISQVFYVSAIPGAPQDVKAAEVSERIDNNCIILVQWDPPTNVNVSDIDHYIITVLSQNIMENELSTIISLRERNCSDDDFIQVTAVSRFGCIGEKSLQTRPSLLVDITRATRSTTSTPIGSTSASGQLGVGAIVGIAIGVILPTLSFLGLVFGCIFYIRVAVKHTGKPTEAEEALLREVSTIRQEDFRKNLMDLYIAFKKDLSEDAKLISVESLSQMMENQTLSKRYIKKAVKIALKTIKLDHGEGVKKALIFHKMNVPRVLESFDNELQYKDTDITMDSLIRAAEQNEHERVFDKLIEIMDNTKPEIVEGLLQKMFKELQIHLRSKVPLVEMKWVTNLPGEDVPMEFPA